MENMRSLADQLRQELEGKPEKKSAEKKSATKGQADRKEGSLKLKKESPQPDILQAILAYDTSGNKALAHVRFDPKTIRLMNQFKMATSVDVTRLVAFAVKSLFETHPELKGIIKQFIQNTEL